MIAGTVIGTVGQSVTCRPSNYIHLAMKKSQPNRLLSILDSALDDDPSAADLAAREGYVDPSSYLAKRPLTFPKWTQICDDYKLVWLVGPYNIRIRFVELESVPSLLLIQV